MLLLDVFGVRSLVSRKWFLHTDMHISQPGHVPSCQKPCAHQATTRADLQRMVFLVALQVILQGVLLYENPTILPRHDRKERVKVR